MTSRLARLLRSCQQCRSQSSFSSRSRSCCRRPGPITGTSTTATGAVGGPARGRHRPRLGGPALLAAPSGGDHLDLVGLGVLLVAAAGWAAGSLYSRRAPLPGRPLVSASMQMLVGGALLMCLALATGEPAQLHGVSTESLLA